MIGKDSHPGASAYKVGNLKMGAVLGLWERTSSLETNSRVFRFP